MDALPATRPHGRPGRAGLPPGPAPAAVPRRAARAVRARTVVRPVPEVSEDYRHLDLDELRSYRTVLQGEESKVSYWRRILQARLDVVRHGRRLGGTDALDPAALRPVLSDERVGAGRTALLQVRPVDDVPPLPDLRELWERQVAPDDDGGLAVLEADLARAEEQLSAYRAALHQRLEAATGELIARYRDRPVLCLTSLPLPVPARRRAASA